MNNTTLNMTTLDGGVIIKRGTAPAPPSGGESGNTSNWRYFDVSNDKGNSYVAGHIIKAKAYGMTCIIPFGTLDFLGANVEKKAIGIDMNVGYCEMGTSEVVAYGTTIEPSLSEWFANGVVEITKEQFYTLN